MALRAVPEHPKFSLLKSILHTPKGTTLGWLESIWHFCASFTPAGNIGKYTDAAIESWVEWDGDPGALVAALVEAGWIDRHPAHRLLVHDWHEHADDQTDLRLARAGERYANGSAPRMRRLSVRERQKIQTQYVAVSTEEQFQCAQVATEPPDELLKDDSVRTSAHGVAENTDSCAQNTTTRARARARARASKTLPREKREEAGIPPSRFALFRAAIDRWWISANPKMQVPWGGREGAALSALLAEAPKLSVEDFERMLAARGASDVALGERPGVWLGRITDYAHGPLDRFRKPIVARREPGTHRAEDVRQRTPVEEARDNALGRYIEAVQRRREYEETLRRGKVSWERPIPDAVKYGDEAGKRIWIAQYLAKNETAQMAQAALALYDKMYQDPDSAQ